MDGRRALPFLEVNGEYGGAPADDATAIRELERLRAAGATVRCVRLDGLLVAGLLRGFRRNMLAARYRPVLENERLIVFDILPERELA